MTRVVLAVSPHPDDELLGAPATLMALRDAGWRIVNLACSLGRPGDEPRRRAELEEACRRAGFELIVPDGLPPIGAADDPVRAQPALAAVIASAAEEVGPDVLVGPSPHDVHHAHELVSRSILDAVESRGREVHVAFWGLWGELPLPNVIVPFDERRLTEIQRALAAHAGELARNRLARLLESRAATNAVLGAERVFGFGVPGGHASYAELLTDVDWSPDHGWRLTGPREFDSLEPCGAPDGPEFGWWLRAPSVRSQSSRGGD